MGSGIDKLVRDNIRNMAPYSTARHEFTGIATVFLDANENAFGSPLDKNYNRYPDPLQAELKEKISRIKGVPARNIFLGNGSDEAIDLLFRIFCEPGRDNVLLFPPTYGMYEVCAATNNITAKKIPLTREFQLDLPAIESAMDGFTKLIFICSPNNPTGNSIHRQDIEILLNNFDGLVVIDEAYINYSRQKTFIQELTEYPNLVVLQTLSKAWGLAGLRVGMAFAGEGIIDYLNKVKYPYNINTATQDLALAALDNITMVNEWIKRVIVQKEKLAMDLLQFSFTEIVYPSDANFLLVKMKNARSIYEFLATQGIIVRDRSRVILCEDCLRITVGTEDENKQLIKVLQEYKFESNE
jgi:histidinol-phosphate aminotransferase